MKGYPFSDFHAEVGFAYGSEAKDQARSFLQRSTPSQRLGCV